MAVAKRLNPLFPQGAEFYWNRPTSIDRVEFRQVANERREFAEVTNDITRTCITNSMSCDRSNGYLFQPLSLAICSHRVIFPLTAPKDVHKHPHYAN